MSVPESAGSPESITALDYIETQQQLEHDARDVLPYDPTHCTYFDGSLRQPVYACLTCNEKSKASSAAGVCYSCSIQCHSDHDLVELFNKRNFTCDCGTTRMSAFGGCNLRKNFNELDIPSSSNRYDHNFEGRFCSCNSKYNPETEKGTMYQCLLGDVCNEDWYHEECILGLPFPPVESTPQPPKAPRGHPTGTDLLHISPERTNKMPPSPKGHPTKVVIDAIDTTEIDSSEIGDDVQDKTEPKSPSGHPTGVKLYPIDYSEFSTSTSPSTAMKEPSSPKGHPTGVNLLPELTGEIRGSASDDEEDGEDHVPPPGFPDDSLFEAFICWKCVEKHRKFLGRWAGWNGVALEAVVRTKHSDAIAPAHARELNGLKRVLEDSEAITQNAKRVDLDHDSDGRDDSLAGSLSSTSSTLSHLSSTSTVASSVDEHPVCKMPTGIPAAEVFSLFLVEGWRQTVCRCADCLKFLDRFPMLKDEEVTYEPPRDEDETSSLLEAGTRALNSLPHISAMESLYAYNKVKTKLASFLKPFAEQGKIVSEQDVKTFFDNIKNK
ncbi:putative zinc finger in N-recognin-domain-containing protein [Lipomyces orientalis]|uniref:Zinc finger in N-recognin-domain-containing protein n=1 Tax=Lipomyces orientalis TaxID=1233043 RepID=A0ACC3TEH7_9ASCO